VVLLEAGPDHPDASTLPRDIIDSSEPTLGHDWGYTADLELDRGIPLPRARIMGGCSSTNACFALRGAPEDYDAWASLGNPGWSFADVLDDFRRLENDLDFVDQWHGSDGLIPIRRHPPHELNSAQAAFIDGALASVRRRPQPTGHLRSRTDASQRSQRHADEHSGDVPRPGTIPREPDH
jgi:choline dehydrogenase